MVLGKYYVKLCAFYTLSILNLYCFVKVLGVFKPH